MSICLSYKKGIFSKRWLFKECILSPKGIDGLIQFSSGNENSKIGYVLKLYKELSELEIANFWFEKSTLELYQLPPFLMEASGYKFEVPAADQIDLGKNMFVKEQMAILRVSINNLAIICLNSSLKI
jgi:hypothetical protein